MMDVNISAALAWAVPVRPDDLGASLQAFNKCLPALRTLRLCHKFGTGPKAYITKLPNEILTAVEDYVFQQAIYSFSGHWKWLFRHYESCCEPFIDHVEDPSILMDCKEEFRDELCEACQNGDDDDCAVDCDEKVMEHMNQRGLEEGFDDWRYEDCEARRAEWEEMINQNPKGDFAKYDKVLRKHFGLELVFAPTRKAAGSNVQWPHDPRHQWHPEDELKTTICYLTLPKKSSIGRSFAVSEIEGGIGMWLVEGAQSSYVNVPTLANKQTRVKQFRDALRILKLQSYIHPSQLKDTVTAEAPKKRQASKEGGDANEEMSDGCAKDEVKEWPQLIMLVKSLASSD